MANIDGPAVEALLTALVQRLGPPPRAPLSPLYHKYREVLLQAGIEVPEGAAIQAEPALITLGVDLLAGTTTKSDSQRVPDKRAFLVERLAGDFGYNTYDGAAEADLVGPSNPTGIERMNIKAGNCQINIKRSDAKVEVTINQDIRLLSILGGLGAPLEVYWVFVPGETITAEFTLSSTNAAVVGASTRYGVMFVGTYLYLATGGKGR